MLSKLDVHLTVWHPIIRVKSLWKIIENIQKIFWNSFEDLGKNLCVNDSRVPAACWVTCPVRGLCQASASPATNQSPPSRHVPRHRPIRGRLQLPCLSVSPAYHLLPYYRWYFNIYIGLTFNSQQVRPDWDGQQIMLRFAMLKYPRDMTGPSDWAGRVALLSQREEKMKINTALSGDPGQFSR